MKKIYILLITLVTILILLVSAGFAFETEKTLTLPTEGLKALRIDCGAGRLEVAGRRRARPHRGPGRDQRRRGRTSPRWTSSSRTTSSSSSRRGETAPSSSPDIERHWGFIFDETPGSTSRSASPRAWPSRSTTAPATWSSRTSPRDVAIDDSSGDIRVARLGGRLEIDDGSGDIDIREVAGDIAIDDGSGDIDVLKTGGSVKVDDGSGDITIDGVGGDVLIEDAGSGDVRIDNVKGRVIRHDIDEDDDEDDDTAARLRLHIKARADEARAGILPPASPFSPLDTAITSR